MEPTSEEPKDVIVLGAIKKGAKKFDKIQNIAKVDPEELNSILEKLEERGLITVEEKKSWLGKKIEIKITEKGSKEVDERIHELQGKWDQMSMLYKSGDKQKLKNFMDDNKSFLPMMMFFGVMDMIMFSMMFSMMGSMMTDYVPAESMPADTGAESSSDMGSDGGGSDGGGFDFDVGF
jgi:DNA-binding HxlR family transcriptional regulator